MKPRSQRMPVTVDGVRNRLLARIHVLAKELALSDESYRDILERVGGERSAALLDDRKLYDVVKHLDGQQHGKQREGRPMADSPMARRCRALWLTLWNLDEIDNGAERALAAFVQRQTGREDMRFCNAEQLSDVIEALKDMCGRAGLDASPGRRIAAPKMLLVREQWARLHKQGWAKVAGDWGVMGYARACRVVARDMSLDQMAPADLDNLAMKLGVLVRQQRLGRRRQVAPHEVNAGEAG